MKNKFQVGTPNTTNKITYDLCLFRLLADVCQLLVQTRVCTLEHDQKINANLTQSINIDQKLEIEIKLNMLDQIEQTT